MKSKSIADVVTQVQLPNLFKLFFWFLINLGTTFPGTKYMTQPEFTVTQVTYFATVLDQLINHILSPWCHNNQSVLCRSKYVSINLASWIK